MCVIYRSTYIPSHAGALWAFESCNQSHFTISTSNQSQNKAVSIHEASVRFSRWNSIIFWFRFKRLQTDLHIRTAPHVHVTFHTRSLALHVWCERISIRFNACCLHRGRLRVRGPSSVMSLVFLHFVLECVWIMLLSEQGHLLSWFRCCMFFFLCRISLNLFVVLACSLFAYQQRQKY